MSEKKMVIQGAAGRMGKTLIRCLLEQRVPGLTLSGAVDLWDAPGLGEDVGILSGGGAAGVLLGSNLLDALESCDAVVDFSNHFGTAGNAPRMAASGKAWVIGTTGLSPEEEAAVSEASRQIPVVMAPNMSLGVNLLMTLVKQAAAALYAKGYDIEIVERHHRLKKDSPSGTALGLGKAAAEGAGLNLLDVACHGRDGLQEDIRPQAEIGFHAIRGGDYVGDHTVLFAGEGESIELSHRATTRDTFALGALRAADWAVGKAPGLYSMQDVLGLR